MPWKSNSKSSKPKHSTEETIPRTALPSVAEPGKRVTDFDIRFLGATFYPLLETHYDCTTFETVFIDKTIACMQKAVLGQGEYNYICCLVLPPFHDGFAADSESLSDSGEGDQRCIGQ